MGTRIRQIQTEKKVVDGKPVVVPVLDDAGQEIELWSIDIPPDLESAIPKDLDCTDQDAVELWMLEERERQAAAKAEADRVAQEKQQAQAASDAAATEQLNASEE